MTLSSITRNVKEKQVTRPFIFDLSKPNELQKFNKLVKENPHLTVSNQIDGQLVELMKIMHPQLKLSDNQAMDMAEKHTQQKNFMTYGVWVHYPWNNTLVHLLPEEEFILVRSSRNNYKITPEEQQILGTKKVGVIGLSVGQSISITMAMERTFGEIRIADFDELELTNLNRIRASVTQLGLSKVAIVAREIAEIDPFLKVTCFWEGITEANIEDFLLKDGKLDLVADECDTIHIKFLARQQCKSHGIPVLMDTSDNGMLDVERFDLEPTRGIFHGLVDHLDIDASKNLKTNEQKIAYTLPIIGLDQASTRIKASMMEIEQSICTWPQLSSDVALGGAISTNVIRRIFLDQFLDSGRYYVNTNELIKTSNPSPKTSTPSKFKVSTLEQLNNADLSRLTVGIPLDAKRIRATIDAEDSILTSAIYAPSGANCQPWKWLVADTAYYLFHDRYFSESFTDYEDTASHLAMGCAIENFILKAHEEGYQVKNTPLPFGENHPLKSVVQLFERSYSSFDLEPISNSDLSLYTESRLTNRNHSPRTGILPSKLDAIVKASNDIPGSNLRFITSDEQLDELAELIAIVDKIRLLHPQCHYELFHKELRKTEIENLTHRDGIDMALMDISASEKVGLEIASNPEVIQHLSQWNKGDGLGKMSKDLIHSASAVGYMTMPTDDAINFYNGGRATELAWLEATKQNLAFQPMTVLPYFLTRLTKGNGRGFSPSDIVQLSSVKKRFDTLFPAKENAGRIFLFRLATAQTPTKLSLRREKNDLIHIKE